MTWAELILGNLFLASLIGVLALVVGRSGRRAATAHALWVMFFAKLITPPIVSFPLPIPTLHPPRTTTATTTPVVADLIPVNPVSANPNAGTAVTVPKGIAQPLAPATSIDSNRVAPASVASANVASALDKSWLSTANLGWILFAIWFAGFAMIAIRGFVRLVRFRRLLIECGNDDDEASETVRTLLANHHGWVHRRRSPRVVRVNVRVSPMLFGFAARPIIVCPEQLWQTLSAQDRRAFLAHETAHYHRRDHWVRWLEWFVSAVYWWFPGVYFAQKQLERHEEACCDAWAVKRLETKPRHYAEALLRVVDFISDHQIGLPALSSGMQPTDSLEERLRLLMRNELDEAAPRLHTWGSGLACAAIWMVHPDAYHLQWQPSGSKLQPAVAIDTLMAPLPQIDAIPQTEAVLEASLPEPPRGFWNAPPIRNWAGFSLDVSGYRLNAISGKGYAIERGLSEPLVFDNQGLTAIAEIPASGRVIIGDSKGNVRLWDLAAGMPVSLLGRHSSGVTSLTVTNDGSVFSADSSGAVIRWELQSGQTIARWTCDDASHSSSTSAVGVQSIRAAQDGQWVAVLCGDWRETSTPKTLYLLDGGTLAQLAKQVIDADAAIVLQDDLGNWCSVTWNGLVRDIVSDQPIGALPKHHVSALLLSQHADLSINPSPRSATAETP